MSLDSLKSHVSKVHCPKRDRTHECIFCEKGFFYSGHLSRHIRNHVREKCYPCKICSKEFSENFKLFEHISRHHTKEKPKKCKVCSADFLTSRELSTHHICMHSGKLEKKNQMQ